MVVLNLFNSKFNELSEFIELKYCIPLLEKNVIQEMDAAFIEGAIARPSDLEKLKKIRENTKKLVVLGGCAATGWPSTQRNFFPEEMKKEISGTVKRLGQLEKISLAKDFVKVDEVLNGCPIELKAFEDLMEKLLKEFNVK